MKDSKYSLFIYGNAFLVCFLTILFIILKLFNVINWSWTWVFSPVWISYLLTLIAIFIYLPSMQ